MNEVGVEDQETNRMVSSGYEARPAPMVTPQPSMNEARKLPLSAPTNTTGLSES